MKQRNTGLHVGKYRKNRTFSSRLTETILPSALIFCALAGLLTTVTGLTAILSLFASGLIFLALFTTVKHFRKEAILLPAALVILIVIVIFARATLLNGFGALWNETRDLWANEKGILLPLAQTDNSGLWLAGILLGLCLAVYCFFVAKKRHYPRAEKFTIKNFLRALWLALPALGAMLVVVGSVLLGWMTATEAAAAACIYTFIFTFVVEKAGTVKDIYVAFSRTIRTIGSVLILAACATAFSWVITYLRIPQMVTAGLFAITSNKYVMLLIINVILLIMGCFMNMVSIVYIMTPILLPIVTSFGMHPVTFGIMMIMNLGIGLLTPPVGQVLFVGSSISGLSVERLTKAMLPQMAFMIIALILIALIPGVTMWLPTVLGYI